MREESREAKKASRMNGYPRTRYTEKKPAQNVELTQCKGHRLDKACLTLRSERKTYPSLAQGTGSSLREGTALPAL